MSTAALTYEAAPPAFNQQFGFNLAGMVWQYKLVTSDASGLNIANGPAILGGAYLVTGTGSLIVYDSASIAGNKLIDGATATVHFNGNGVLCANGITCDWTSGTWLVLFAPAV